MSGLMWIPPALLLVVGIVGQVVLVRKMMDSGPSSTRTAATLALFVLMAIVGLVGVAWVATTLARHTAG